jgi:hypothetical protein
MPKTTIDYSKIVIYKIVCYDLNVKDIYIGSTTDFTQRKCSHKNITVRDHASKVFAEIVKDRLKKRKTIRTDLLYIMVMCSPNMDDVMTVVHAFGQKKDFTKLTDLFTDSVDPSNRHAIFIEIQKAYKDLERYPDRLSFYREDILMTAKAILKFPKAGIEASDWAEGVQKKLNENSYNLFSSAYTGD